MTSQLKPIKLWGAAGPNPPKVAMILEELSLPYETIAWPLTDVKNPKYVAINPNGRLPAIQDPNTDLTLWESGAIVEYLIEKYDKEHKLSFATGSNEAYLAKQWLYFQVTGQGPYYGQAVWFTKYHGEKLPSAIDRYVKEINRVSAVLETHLTSQKQQYNTEEPWLVGNKVSYADVAFIQWQNLVGMMLTQEQYDGKNFPVLTKWLETLMARPAIAKALKDAAEAMKNH